MSWTESCFIVAQFVFYEHSDPSQFVPERVAVERVSMIPSLYLSSLIRGGKVRLCVVEKNSEMILFESNHMDYTTVSVLGQCWEGLATVQLAKHVPSGKMVVLKRFKMDKTRIQAHLVQHEIVLTRQLKHPNILSYFTSFVIDSEVCVISPLMAFGSCRDLLNTHFNQGLPENAIALILKDVLDGLDYIHRRGIIHRAIRASHILISASGKVCLSGLRYSCPIIEHGKWQKRIHLFPNSSAATNLNWLSPEILEQNLQGYNEKSDIYSIGVTLCELANGADPFAGMPTTLMLIEKVRGATPQLLDCTTIAKDASNEIHGDADERLVGFTYFQANRRFTEGLHQIALLCLQKEAICRPGATQLLSHSYFKANRKSLVLSDLLKPALPLSERAALNTDELANLDTIQRMSDLELFTCEWDF